MDYQINSIFSYKFLHIDVYWHAKKFLRREKSDSVLVLLEIMLLTTI